MAVGGMLERPDLNRVTLDHYAIGRFGADHLLEHGFRRLAFYGIEGPWSSSERCLRFAERAREASVPCEIFQQQQEVRRISWQQRQAPLQRWIPASSRPSASWRYMITGHER